MIWLIFYWGYLLGIVISGSFDVSCGLFLKPHCDFVIVWFIDWLSDDCWSDFFFIWVLIGFWLDFNLVVGKGLSMNGCI